MVWNNFKVSLVIIFSETLMSFRDGVGNVKVQRNIIKKNQKKVKHVMKKY